MEVIKQFCEDTTIHGLPFVVRQKYKTLRIFWLTVVVLAFGGLSYHMYNIISTFLLYQSTESAYQRRDGYEYPDVTLCNLNPISGSNWREAAKNSSRLQTLYTKYIEGNDTGTRTDIPGYAKDLFWSLGDEAVFIGHKLEDMLISCIFQRQPCDKNDFVLFQLPSLFNCFTFKRGRELGETSVGGFASALSLIIYTESLEPPTSRAFVKQPFYMNSNGIRVLIAPSNTLAALGNSGYDVPPGASTSIGFDITEHIRLSEPYSECRSTESMQLEGNVAYSFVECRNICVHKIVIRECGCYPTRYIMRSKRKDVPPCIGQSTSTRGSGTFECQERVLAHIEQTVDYKKECNCHWPCEETTYSNTLSHSQWPSRDSVKSFLENTIENHPKRTQLKAYMHYQELLSQNASDEDIYKWVTSHFLRLNVFANSDIVSVREQKPMYSLTDLLCQVGGCLGLWVGISIITMVEGLDLVVKFIRHVSATEVKVKK